MVQVSIQCHLIPLNFTCVCVCVYIYIKEGMKRKTGEMGGGEIQIIPHIKVLYISISGTNVPVQLINQLLKTL